MFRFSGRCENELISAQHLSSSVNVSNTSEDFSKTMQSYISSNSVESGSSLTNTFKR